MAVRLGFSDQEQQAAQLEAAAYERLDALQGFCVPSLIGHGYMCYEDAYFVATKYIEVFLTIHGILPLLSFSLLC